MRQVDFINAICRQATRHETINKSDLKRIVRLLRILERVKITKLPIGKENKLYGK